MRRFLTKSNRYYVQLETFGKIGFSQEQSLLLERKVYQEYQHWNLSPLNKQWKALYGTQPRGEGYLNYYKAKNTITYSGEGEGKGEVFGSKFKRRIENSDEKMGKQKEKYFKAIKNCPNTEHLATLVVAIQSKMCFIDYCGVMNRVIALAKEEGISDREFELASDTRIEQTFPLHVLYLIKVIEGHLDDCFDQYDVLGKSLALYFFAKLQYKMRSDLYSKLQLFILDNVEDFDQRWSSQNLWSLCVLQNYEQEPFKALINHIKQQVENDELGFKDIQMVFIALARQRHTKDLDLQESMGRSLKNQIDQMRVGSIAMLMRTFAQLKYADEELISLLTTKFQSQIKFARATHLLYVAWAMASLRIYNQDLFSSLAVEILNKQSEYNGCQLANLAYSFARVQHFDKEFFDAIGYNFIQKLPKTSSKYVSLLLWSFGIVRMRKAELYLATSNELQGRNLEQIDAINLVNILWSYAYNDFEDTTLLQGINAALYNKLPELDGNALTRVLWSNQAMGFLDPHYISKIVKLIKGKNLLSGMEIDLQIRLCWSLFKLGTFQQDLMNQAIENIYNNFDSVQGGYTGMMQKTLKAYKEFLTENNYQIPLSVDELQAEIELAQK